MGDLSVTWAHRDRLQQTGYIVKQYEGNIGPEAGTSYHLSIIGEDGVTVAGDWTGLTGTSQVLTATAEASASALPLGRVNSKVAVYLDSARDVYVSYSQHQIFLDRADYGYNYGKYYGGY
jgi:hypothetical protein